MKTLLCKRCGNELKGQQLSYCSTRCSKLHLKKLYKQRNREKVLAYNRWYRSQGLRPLDKKRKTKIINDRDNKCQRCFSTKELNVHHIIPLRRGGTHKKNNLLVLCFQCHMDWEQRMKGYWDIIDTTKLCHSKT